MAAREMTPPSDNPAESLDASPREERLGELINEYFDRRERGEKISAEDFLSEHPDEAAELREHLGGLDLLAKLGSSSRDATRAQTAPFRGKGSSAEDALSEAATALPDIPGYDVLKQIGRGGMGIVYKAIQKSTKRLVALKLLLEGPFASDNARKRFEREIALAAQLKHSNIIPIYDSGQADGRMYYAMEHIFGTALGDYLNAQQLDTAARLGLFLKICGPVSHAHQRGVIHRDIKPTNILVDGDGEPHVLDFGLAKAGLLGEVNTSVTAQIVGTPAYMSPEQAAGDPTGIDTRVDVYALGVLLYEMITGTMPYETNVAMGKILHNIAHAEPAHPSRHIPRIDGDLSAIMLKALEKRKEDRYQSVDALAGDITRFLAGEPISAKPASSLYLLRKAAMRHRFALVAGAMVLLFAVSLGGIVFYFSRKVEQQNVVLRETAQRVTQKEAQVEELVRERNKSEEARANLELAKKVLGPELAKQYETLINPIASGVGGSEDKYTLGLRLLAEGMTELAARENQSKLKENPIDVNAPLTTPKPEWVKTEEPPAKPDPRREEFLRLAEGLITALKTAPPTSQPTSSQPATSQPGATAAPIVPSPPPPAVVPVTP